MAKVKVIQYTKQIHKILSNVKDYKKPQIDLNPRNTDTPTPRPRNDDDNNDTGSAYNKDFTLSVFENGSASTSSRNVVVTISNPSVENGESVCYWNGIRQTPVPRTIMDSLYDTDIELYPGDVIYAGVLSNGHTAVPTFELYRNRNGQMVYDERNSHWEVNNYVTTFDDFAYREIGVVRNSTGNELSVEQSHTEGKLYMTKSTSAKPYNFQLNPLIGYWHTSYSTCTRSEDGLEYRLEENLPGIQQSVCMTRDCGCNVNNLSFVLPSFQSRVLIGTNVFATSSEIVLVDSEGNYHWAVYGTNTCGFQTSVQFDNSSRIYFALKFVPESTSTSTSTSTGTGSSSKSTSVIPNHVEFVARKSPSNGTRDSGVSYYDIGDILITNGNGEKGTYTGQYYRNNINVITQSNEGLATSPQLLWFKTCE